MADMRTRGLIGFAAANRLHFVPPAIVTSEQVATALGIFDESLSAVAG